MIFKLLGLGCKIYTSDNFNLFDAFIVIVLSVDFIVFLSVGESDNQITDVIASLRVVRIVCVFKLAKDWTQFRNLLFIIGDTIKDIRDFTILLGIFIFIAALLGMEFYAYKVAFKQGEDTVILDYESKINLTTGQLTNGTANVDFPDSNFNDFLQAFATVFICLANDGWSTIYIQHTRAAG